MTKQTTTDAYIQALLTAPIDLSSTERMLLKKIGEASQIMADYAKENERLNKRIAQLEEQLADMGIFQPRSSSEARNGQTD